MKTKIMTLGYFPFTMGGRVWRPIMTEVEAQSLHELGGGYRGYLVVAPNGKTFVAESETGALVGPTIKAVKHDIATAEKAVMDKQMKEAREWWKEPTTLTPAKFWRMLRVDK